MRLLRTILRNTILGIERRLPIGLRVALRDAGDLVVPLDAPDHDIALRMGSAHDFSMRRFSCRKEPETVAWLREHLRPGDVLYDVGANVGAYALFAAVATGRQVRVWAFEPAFANYASLCRNILLNDCGDAITPVAMALGCATGASTLVVGDPRSGAANHTLESVGNGVGELAGGSGRLGVLAFRLDDWIAHGFGPRPTHLKIDVDGHEVAVLEGATATLAHPDLRSVLVEVEPPLREAVLERLDAAGFHCAAEHARPSVSNCVFLRTNEAVERTNERARDPHSSRTTKGVEACHAR